MSAASFVALSMQKVSCSVVQLGKSPGGRSGNVGSGGAASGVLASAGAASDAPASGTSANADPAFEANMPSTEHRTPAHRGRLRRLHGNESSDFMPPLYGWPRAALEANPWRPAR